MPWLKRKQNSSQDFLRYSLACRRVWGPEITTSPKKVPFLRARRFSQRGKDNTSVTRSMPRNFRLRSRTAASPTRVRSRSESGTLSSVRIVETVSRIFRGGIFKLDCRFLRIILAVGPFFLLDLQGSGRHDLQFDGQVGCFFLLGLRIFDSLV